MAQRGFGVGMIVLLIAMAIVLVLVAKSWRSVAPAAQQVQGAQSGIPMDDHGQAEAANEVRSGELPKLQDTQRETDEHAARIQEALNEIE